MEKLKKGFRMRKTLVLIAMLTAALMASEIELGTAGPPRGYPFGC